MEYETFARERLKPSVYDYIATGADDEFTVQQNRTAFERIMLRPRVLVDVSEIDQRTTILGIPLEMPVLLSMTAAQTLCHPDGELATARAAHSMGTLCMLGTNSHYTVAQVNEATNGPVWFQLYPFTEPAINKSMIDQAVAADVKALVLTVDTPYVGWRERNMRNNFKVPANMVAGHFVGITIDQNSQSTQVPSGLFKAEHLRSRAL